MTTPVIFGSVIFMGLTCSMGCGTVTTPFMLGSLLGDGGSISESRKAITLFSIGKVVSLVLMGILSSIFGSIILTYVENLYPQTTIWIIRIATFLFGFKILYSTIKFDFIPQKQDDNTSPCSSCGGCSKSKKMCSSSEDVVNTDEFNFDLSKTSKSYFLAGLLYATIPCGPLLTCLTYASTMNLILAILLLGLFGIVNSIIPVFFYASLVGVANTEFTKSSSEFLKYIKLSGGLILIYASIFKVY